MAPGSPKRPRPTSTTGRLPGPAWLRKYYPDGTDEPHYDATPAVEKALQWLQSLREREFVGTESRLKVDLRICCGRSSSAPRPIPRQRLAELRRQREAIDGQIARIEAGELPMLDETRGARPLPAVRRHRAGAARRLPRGGGELPQARPPAPGEDRRLARRQGRAAGRRARQPGVDSRFGPGTSPSRRSTASCCPRRGRRSCPACWTGCTHWPGSPSATPGCGTFTTTGWTPPSAPRRRSASSPNSSGASWTTRCGSRTAG